MVACRKDTFFHPLEPFDHTLKHLVQFDHLLKQLYVHQDDLPTGKLSDAGAPFGLREEWAGLVSFSIFFERFLDVRN